MIPERYAPMTYALFRIVFGFVFMLFGLQKMFGWLGGQQAELMTLQPAAFLASGEMAVAYWYIHVSVIAMGEKGPGLPIGLLPVMNNGERATLFCFAFLYIASRGAGIWSVDAAMQGPAARSARV
jgi:putative oxidoreductase